MALSSGLIRRLMIGLGSASAGNELANAVNKGPGAKTLAAQIVATNVSATIDFAALQVGDQVVQIPATAGNSKFSTVATKGTLPVAAVVGDLYQVWRSNAATVTDKL